MANINKALVKLSSAEKINILSDPKRMEVFRLLMVKPRTVSQLGRLLGEYPAGIRYHIKKLEQAELVELIEVRELPGYSEKYYSSKASAVHLVDFIFPKWEQKQLIFMGSDDLAFEQLISIFDRENCGTKIFHLPIGSLDGLIALRQGVADFSGCHLYDPESGKYNSPFVKHFFPEQPIYTITLAHRVQGIIISKGNPKAVAKLEDLARKEVRFINRNRGSGTRIWLDTRLGEIGMNADQVSGYTQEVYSHLGISYAIKSGHADVGIGLIAAAYEDGLDFIPMFEEQYDLILTVEQYQKDHSQILFDLLTSGKFRKSINDLQGYSSRHTGTVSEVKIINDQPAQSHH